MNKPPPPPNDVNALTGDGKVTPPWQRFFLDMRNFVIEAGTAPADARFIVQGTVNAALTNAQFLGALATGILKVTTATGVLTTAVSADFTLVNAGSLLGATLAATVVNSSLQTLGTITTGVWNAGAVTSSGVLNGLEVSLPSGGAAPTIGQLTLVGGTKTVNTAAATASARLFFQRVSTGGTIGFASTYTVVPGVSFTLNSDNPLDTSVYNWLILDTH